jgi:uncharacterized protein HemX
MPWREPEAPGGAVTDTQLLTLAVAIILPLSMLLYSNSRITEAKETLRAEIQTLRADMSTGFARTSGEINLILQRIENKLDHYAETQATHSERIDKLEKGG